jgi:nucleoside-diphosphate-sugar epimerase
MIKKVVVTGASGFIGSNLASFLLKKDFEVILIVRRTSDITKIESHQNAKLRTYIYDNDLTGLVTFFKEESPLCTFHLASNFTAEHNSSQINDLVSSNITFGLHLLEAMKESGCRNFINTGTSWQHFLNMEYNPVCLYAATKQAFEDLIEYYVQAEEFKVYTLKLFDTYGENDPRPKLINLLNKFTENNTSLEMSPGLQRINLVHISDVCEAYHRSFSQLVLEEGACHKKFAIKHEKSFQLKEVVELFEKLSKKRLNIEWGAKPYRKREVMDLWDDCEILPGWQAQISLEMGLQKRL